MFSFFGTVAEYIFDQSLQIAVLFGVVGVLCFLLRRASSHVRYLLWGLVIAKCIFPSVMKVSLAVLPEKEIVVAAAQPEFAAEPYTVSTGVSVHADLADFVSAAPVVYEPSIFDRLGEIETIEWVGIVWAFGAVLFLAGVCFRALRLNRRLRCLRLVAEFDFCVPGNEGIDIWQIDGIGQPFVWGLWRGSVYVPGNFTECGSVEDQRGILMHEFAHVCRFDAGVNVLQIVAQGLFWFHPLVWFANNMVRREREKCCDEAAIANLKSVPRDYGNAIIDTLAREYESDIPVPSLAVAGPVKNIEDRLKTIMRPGKKFYTRCGMFALLTILLLAMFALPVGCVLTSRGGNQAVQPETKTYEEKIQDELKDASLVRFDKKEKATAMATMFYGLNLSEAAFTKKKSELGDVYEERPAGSGSFHIRNDVIKIDTPRFMYSGFMYKVYYVQNKDVFYIRQNPCTTDDYKYYGPFKGDPRKVLKGLSLERIAESGGKQVSLETRFVVVSSDFLEDIGLDALVGKEKKIKETYSAPEVSYKFFEGSKAMDGKKAAAILKRMGVDDPNDVEFGLLDDKGVDFLLRMTDAHKDGRILVAPKITVMNEESGYISVVKDNNYISEYRQVAGDKAKSFEAVIETFDTGIKLDLLPKVLKDSGNVEVTFDSSMTDDISFQQYKHESGKTYDVPDVLETQLKGRFEIPDGKTFVVAGLKVLSKVEKSKRDPVIKRGVMDRYSEKKYEENVVETMIILIKPTVIMPEVIEDKAIRAYEE